MAMTAVTSDAIQTSENNVEHMTKIQAEISMTPDEMQMRGMSRMPPRPLERRLVGLFPVIAVASTVVITWQNMLLLSPIALSAAGQAGFFFATLIVFCCMIPVYRSLLEKAERWPSAAGQYDWVARLAPPTCASFLSYTSGFLLFVSWGTFLAAGVLLCASGIQSTVFLIAGRCPYWLPTVISIGISLILCAINRFACNFLSHMELPIFILHTFTFCVVTALLLGLRVNGGQPYASAQVVFTEFRNGGSWASSAAATCLAFLVPVSSATGYDCVFHLSEEIRGAGTMVPKALAWAVLINFALGIGIVLIVDFSVTNIDALFSTALSESSTVGPVVQIFYTATGSKLWTTVPIALVLATLFTCCLNSFAAASRQLWALSENKGLPYSTWIRTVHTKKRVPHRAIYITLLFPIILPLINLVSTLALNAIVSLVLVSILMSYALVIGCSLYDRSKNNSLLYNGNRGIWLMRKTTGIPLDGFSLLFLISAAVIAMFPPSTHPSAKEFNWAPVMLVGIFALGLVWWLVHARNAYERPGSSK